jgi:hypothetical protein
MARGAEAKLRRRNQRKNVDATENGGTGDDDDDDEVIDMFGTAGGKDGASSSFPPFPTPVTGKVNGSSLKGGTTVARKAKSTVVVEDVDSDEDDDYDNLPKQKKKYDTSQSSKAQSPIKKTNSGIKTTPLILLILMVGTTLLPALIYLGDYASTFLAKNNMAGSMGYHFGIGSVPKKRVLSFYEKHAPEKVNDVSGILSKHYGNYPQLIKKLERKYHDYGYFVGWQEDEAPLKIGTDYLQSMYDVWIQQYWNRYAPQVLKTAFRNVRYNFTFLYKRFRKVWKKHIWPLLEPIFGVPDGAAAQKRKDAAQARKQKSASRSGGSARRKNTDFRDDVE